jgi:peptidoglycan/LPS O-acetylase OafA/YrhL
MARSTQSPAAASHAVGHSSNLDILRSFALVAVVISHLFPTMYKHGGFHHPALYHFVKNIGRAGVIAFFVHTSLVLMYSIERMHASPGHVTVRFYVRRFFRVYPLQLFAILLVLALHLPSMTWKMPPPITRTVVISNLLMVQNLVTGVSVLGPLWSLPYEMQMYLVLPALYLWARGKRGIAFLTALLVFFCILGFQLSYATGHLNMAAYVPCFLAGVLCYTLRTRIRARIPALLWTPFVGVLFAVYCAANLSASHSWLAEAPTFWSGWIFSLVLALAINAFQDSRSTAGNFVANRVALYSYGMYLMHVPVLYFVFLRVRPSSSYISVPLFVALTVAAALATFYTIESPCIELGRRLTSGGTAGSEPSEPMPAP